MKTDYPRNSLLGQNGRFLWHAIIFLAGSLPVAAELAADAQTVLREVTFAPSHHTNAPGETVSGVVRVSGFTQVTSVQFTLQWDPAVLAFAGTGGYGLNGLGAGNFGTTLTNSGKLTFSWDDPDAVGVTVADGAVIFNVSFVVIGSAGSVSPLALVDVPTAREVAVNFEVATFGSVDGELWVVPPTSPPVITQQPDSRTNVIGSTASFSVTATGTSPLSYQWFFQGTNALPGRTDAVLTLTNTQPAQAGDYRVVVANPWGAVTSDVAVLTVVLPDRVTFGLSSHTNQPGQTVTAQVAVREFAQVASVQFTLQWDPAVLVFAGTGGYGLNGLGAGNFGTTLTNSGKLTFSWDDPDAVGVTVADGAVIFNVSFVVIGSAGSVSPLALVDVPTAREVAVNFGVVTFRGVEGGVSVKTPLVLICAPDKVVECGRAWDFDEPTAAGGDCGTNVALSILNNVTNGDACLTQVTRTWRATDCNNKLHLQPDCLLCGG